MKANILKYIQQRQGSVPAKHSVLVDDVAPPLLLRCFLAVAAQLLSQLPLSARRALTRHI